MDRNGAGYPGCVSDGGTLCVDAGHLIEVRASRLRPSAFLGANRMALSKFIEPVSIKRPLRDLSSEQFESCDCGDGGTVAYLLDGRLCLRAPSFPWRQRHIPPLAYLLDDADPGHHHS